MLVLAWQLLFHISFQAPEEIGAQDGVQLRDALPRFVVIVCAVFNSFLKRIYYPFNPLSQIKMQQHSLTRKYLAKVLSISELRSTGHEKPQQGPQLRQIVLQRRPGEQQPAK